MITWLRAKCITVMLATRGGEGESRTRFACRHATDAARARRVLLSVVCLIQIQVPHRGASSPKKNHDERSFVIAPEVGVEVPHHAAFPAKRALGRELNGHLLLFRQALVPHELPGRLRSPQARSRHHRVDYSVVMCPVFAVSLSSRCERCCSGDRRFTGDAVGRGSGGRDRTLIARARVWRPTVRRPLIDFFVSPEGFEPSPHRVKAECATVTPRAQNELRGRAFESLLLHHVGAFGIEPK
jgi:hypothetical protein